LTRAYQEHHAQSDQVRDIAAFAVMLPSGSKLKTPQKYALQLYAPVDDKPDGQLVVCQF
jgi:hypothetical protein